MKKKTRRSKVKAVDSETVITRSADMTVTSAMLYSVRDDLRSEIRAIDHKMESKFKSVDAQFNDINAHFHSFEARFKSIDARFSEVDARFSEVDARFNKIDARFDRVDARLESMDSRLAKMESSIHQMKLMMEEQRNNNNYTLEHLGILFGRQERVEQRMDHFEQHFMPLKP